MLRIAAAALLWCALCLAGTPAFAQSSGETEKKLQTIKKELNAVAADRREIESRRGAATRELRAADEQVAASSRRLRATAQQLAASEEELAGLQQRRDHLQGTLGDRREELALLLRAAYAQGDAAPLKLLLAQDRVADANRLLTYHRYVQRDRAERIAALTRELAEIETVERDIVARRAELDATRKRQREELARLERDRKERKVLVADLDQRYQGKRSREKALGRDAKGLEKLLKQLRAAARRAGATAPPAPAPRPVATGPAVGGAGWPVAGTLLAGYGAKLPDGRASEGLLIAASAGTTVKAAADGTVVYAEWMSGFGLILIIDHGNGYMSLYAHNDALLRDAGDRVRRGDPVSTVGSSGGHGRPALYFELRRNGEPVNPGSWLGS